MKPYELALAIQKGRHENGGADTPTTLEWAEELSDLVDDDEMNRLLGEAKRVVAEAAGVPTAPVATEEQATES